MPGVDDRVMVNHHGPVPGGVDVELDAVRSQLNGPLECGERILGMRLVRAAMGNSFGWIAAWACGQAFLGVVAFCWMSAKL